MCSLASTNGPSVMTTSPPPARTTVAASGPWSAPPKTNVPLASISASKAATRSMKACISSGVLGAPGTSPSTATWTTGTESCVLLPLVRVVPALTPSTNGIGPRGHPGENSPERSVPRRRRCRPGHQVGGLRVQERACGVEVVTCWLYAGRGVVLRCGRYPSKLVGGPSSLSCSEWSATAENTPYVLLPVPDTEGE